MKKPWNFYMRRTTLPLAYKGSFKTLYSLHWSSSSLLPFLPPSSTVTHVSGGRFMRNCFFMDEQFVPQFTKLKNFNEQTGAILEYSIWKGIRTKHQHNWLEKQRELLWRKVIQKLYDFLCLVNLLSAKFLAFFFFLNVSSVTRIKCGCEWLYEG